MTLDPRELFEFHSQIIEKSISKRRFHHEDIIPLIKKLDKQPLFDVNNIGSSYEGRDIYSVKIGRGKTKVMLWSQMHGNEPTATMALLDIFNFFQQNDSFSDLKKYLLDHLTLYFIPMLNPDGINRYQRRNALGIDMNRDAVSLQSPESQILKSFRDKINPEFGFNLHDQDNAHGAGNSGNPATISFLAPPIDYSKTVNNTREKAIQLIASLYPVLNTFIPGHIGRYSDDFEPRAFGENIQIAGTSTVLLESGGYKRDLEKQFVRKINFLAILSAAYFIASGDYQHADMDTYFNIPQNEKRMFDFIIRNVRLYDECNVDIGITRNEKEIPDQQDFYFHSNIDDLGDLTGYYGYDEFDAKGLNLHSGATYPQTFNSLFDIERTSSTDLLRRGYTHVRVKSRLNLPEFSEYPLHIITSEKDINSIRIEQNPNFLLYKKDQLKYVVINGFLFDINNNKINIPNGIIERG